MTTTVVLAVGSAFSIAFFLAIVQVATADEMVCNAGDKASRYFVTYDW
jgi:hypothetical protein